MMRDGLNDASWMNHWIAFDEDAIAKRVEICSTPSANPAFRPQFIFELALKHLHLLLRRYSRGDPITELQAHFQPLLDAWEEAEHLGVSVWTPEIQHSRHAWSVNLDHYIDCFWLTGLALSLNIPDAHWQRLLKLMGNEGEDALLDRVIAARQPDRKIGTTLCHPKPYQRLLDAVQAPAGQQPALLREFVTHWYAELDRPPKKGLSRMTAMYDRPYWYAYDQADGAYFGFWCIEAVAAVKALGLDDSLCLGLRHYPGDLLRPQGPSTHSAPSVVAAITSPAAEIGDAGYLTRLRKALFSSR
jgi:hypothetical protein